MDRSVVMTRMEMSMWFYYVGKAMPQTTQDWKRDMLYHLSTWLIILGDGFRALFYQP